MEEIHVLLPHDLGISEGGSDENDYCVKDQTGWHWCLINLEPEIMDVSGNLRLSWSQILYIISEDII